MAAVTSRYARAFADAVFDMKVSPAETIAQLRDIVSMVKSNVVLQRIWQNPAIPAEQKHSLLDAITARGAVSRIVRNFIAVLIDHRRIEELPQIARQVESEFNSRLGFAEADITSARELSGEERQALERRVEHMTGKKVRPRYSIDAAILGGAVVRLGSTIYDGSVKGQLQRMKEQLAAD